jgi:hypothetical protein
VKIESFKPIMQAELIAEVRKVRLKGHNQVKPYHNSTITLVSLDTSLLSPCQRYVIRRGVDRVHDIRKQMMPYDIFDMAFGLWLKWDSGEMIPFLPPVVEATSTSMGAMTRGSKITYTICDGMHRVYAAREAGVPITCLLIEEPTHPYYAYPLDGGWNEVQVVDIAPPSGDQRKAYREPDDHKALFRDFNERFPGVQAKR